jgi:hypothetical protein
MSAVLAALFSDPGAAQAARTALVNDGFPTDRVSLTSQSEPGPADLSPASGLAERLAQYFEQVLDSGAERAVRERLVDKILLGAGVLIVQPRGAIETQRAGGILAAFDALEVHDHDLGNQALERAASPDSTPIVKQLLPQDTSKGRRRRRPPAG